MGLGYNLGNLFDCYNNSLGELKNPDDQITLCGNSIPTKKMIKSIKKNGFHTIRFPVTWMHFMDESGKIDPNWMNRVKEVIDWTIESNMYCILNVHNDGIPGNWLSKGLMSKNKYINLWKQIADKFQVYDEHLNFESMNEYEYNDTNILFNFTQIFVDTIRNSGGNNIYRLLLIPGIKSNIDLTCSLEYKIPKDPSNNLGISINYYVPGQFTIATEDKPFKYKILTGDVYELHDYKTWGTDSNYKEIATDFNTMKKAFIDKEIPVIISEVGVITEEKKNIISIREYLNFIFSLSAEYDGITSCL